MVKKTMVEARIKLYNNALDVTEVTFSIITDEVGYDNLVEMIHQANEIIRDLLQEWSIQRV